MGLMVALSGAVAASENPPKDEPPSLYALVDRLAASAPLDRSTVERVTGVKLSPLGEGPMSDGFYYARHLKLKDVTIELVDYRGRSEPGKPAKFILLRLSIADACIKRSEIERIYSPLKTFSGAEMDAPSSTVSLDRTESWGGVLFVFPFHGPDCLRDVVFNGDAVFSNGVEK